MKDRTAPSSRATEFNSVKEVEANAEDPHGKGHPDLQHEMATIRTGRASLSLLDHIRVDYYGTPTPLNQVANLHVPEPTMITIQPWDVSQIGAIEKAIRTSDLGLNPSNDGKLIRVPIPPLTEERRKELVKRLHTSPSTIAWPSATSAATPTRRSRSCSRTRRSPRTTRSGPTTRSRR